jgi:hypothetical protein
MSPSRKPGAHPTDHLPALVRKTGWEWRGGSHFDPEIPLAIEVHLQFWDERTERSARARRGRILDAAQRQALDTPDALAYSALHLLRHLLRGSARACHVYEIAWFLERHSGEAQFWNRWRETARAGIAASGSHRIPIGARVVRLRAGSGGGRGSIQAARARAGMVRGVRLLAA